MAAEYRAARRVRTLFVCSLLDRDRLRRLFRRRNIEAVRNSVPIPAPAPVPDEPVVTILCSYSYFPNRVGAEFFLDRVWPAIRARMPSATLVVAGPGSEGIRHHPHPPDGVSFTGFVPDLDQLYASTRVIACPILSGGGTRVKLVEAAAYGRAIVSTRIGAEGLELEDSVHMLLRDEPERFAQACVELLTDRTRAIELGNAAREAAIRHFDRQQIARDLARHIAQAAG